MTSLAEMQAQPLDLRTLQAVRDFLHAGTATDPSKRIPAMFQWLDGQGTKAPHEIASEKAAFELSQAADDRKQQAASAARLAELAAVNAEQKAAEQEAQVEKAETLTARMETATQAFDLIVEQMKAKVAEAQVLNERLDELKKAALDSDADTPDEAGPAG